MNLIGLVYSYATNGDTVNARKNNYFVVRASFVAMVAEAIAATGYYDYFTRSSIIQMRAYFLRETGTSHKPGTPKHPFYRGVSGLFSY